MTEPKIRMISVNEIVPYGKNPRKNDKAVDAVAKSIKEFGFKQPIVIDGNNVIVCGHTRLKAAKKLGITEVPCIIADDLSEEQIKAYRIADNKVGELAEWDWDLLTDELCEISAFDMTEFGFEAAKKKTEVAEDEYNVILPSETRTKIGEIYRLGQHRLMCGDSTSAKDVQALTGGGTDGHANHGPTIQYSVCWEK